MPKAEPRNDVVASRPTVYYLVSGSTPPALNVAGQNHAAMTRAVKMLDHAFQHDGHRLDAAAQMPTEAVMRHPLLGDRQEWVGRRRVVTVDQSTGAMPFIGPGSTPSRLGCRWASRSCPNGPRRSG